MFEEASGIRVEEAHRVTGRGAYWALYLAVAAVMAASGWGLFSVVVSDPPPALVGEAVEASGGYVQVDRVIPEHMAPMQMSKFSASGMSMSGMGMDMTPDGQRRLTVEVTLSGGASGLSYSPRMFLVEESAPIRDQLGSGELGPGEAVSGSLTFQVPEEAKDLTLSFDGGRPVDLGSQRPLAEGDGSAAEGGHGGH